MVYQKVCNYKDLARAPKIKIWITIHFFKCTSKIWRVCKTNKPIALGFASTLISNNLKPREQKMLAVDGLPGHYKETTEQKIMETQQDLEYELHLYYKAGALIAVTLDESL